MNLHQLIQQRDALLRRARLANVAFAYDRLGGFAQRIARANLRGLVTVHTADPAADRFLPTLVAEEGSQAVLDEHFVDEDIVDLTDILRFLSEESERTEFSFRLEELARGYLPPLRRELEQAGVHVQAEDAADGTMSGRAAPSGQSD